MSCLSKLAVKLALHIQVKRGVRLTLSATLSAAEGGEEVAYVLFFS